MTRTPASDDATAPELFVDLLQDTDYSVQVQSTFPFDGRNVPGPDFAIFRGEGR